MAEVSFWVHVLIWAPPILATILTIWYWYIHTPWIIKKISKK